MNHHIDILTASYSLSRIQPIFTKTLILTIFIFSVTTLSDGAASNDLPAYCAEATYPILITIHGLRNDLGSIKAKLYGDNPDEFLVAGKKLNSKLETAQRPSTLLCLQAPHPGMYAIAIHHDENGNKKLDRNWIGLPQEGVGFSNNPELFLAAPDHEDVVFQVLDGVTTVDIGLRY